MKTLRIQILLAALAAVGLTCSGLMAQSTQTVDLSVTMSAPVLADIHQHWLDQVVQQMGTIVGAVDGTTASVTMTVSQSTLSQAAPAFKVGDTAVLGGDTCAVTAASGDAGNQTITCTRGQYPLSPIVAHEAGEKIFLLKYPTPWEMLVIESLRPYAIQITQGLGSRSQTFGAAITGGIAGQ